MTGCLHHSVYNTVVFNHFNCNLWPPAKTKTEVRVWSEPGNRVEPYHFYACAMFYFCDAFYTFESKTKEIYVFLHFLSRFSKFNNPFALSTVAYIFIWVLSLQFWLNGLDEIPLQILAKISTSSFPSSPTWAGTQTCLEFILYILCSSKFSPCLQYVFALLVRATQRSQVYLYHCRTIIIAINWTEYSDEKSVHVFFVYFSPKNGCPGSTCFRIFWSIYK